MNPVEKQACFSERDEGIASIATIARTLSPPNTDSHNGTLAYSDGHTDLGEPNHTNGAATIPRKSKLSSKYRHVAAVHSGARSSCLSRDAELTPSFLGFRNLMVIVLSTYFSMARILQTKNCKMCRVYVKDGLIKRFYSRNESKTGH